MSPPKPQAASNPPAADDPAAEFPAAVRAHRQVFASLFTPSWTLGLLLAACLFLPSYRGCNGTAIHLSEAFVLEDYSTSEIYTRYLMVWPMLFGLIVFFGTVLLAWSRNPQRASVLWYGFASLIVVHSLLAIAAIVGSPPNLETASDWSWQEVLLLLLWSSMAVGLPLLLVITKRYCQDWYHAAIWMQLAISLAAAVCATYVIPSLLLASELLIGGKLMITCSVGLVVTTIVQQLDGRRVLVRQPGSSPLQLSMKGTLLLMSVGGIACSWVTACIFVEL